MIIVECPLQQYTDSLEQYYGIDVYMARMKSSIDYYAAGSHQHEHYEFIMAEIDIPEGIVGDGIMLMKRGMVFPINSKQSHGTAKAILNAKLNTININKSMIDKTASSMLGTKTFCFENENHDLSNELRVLISMYEEDC